MSSPTMGETLYKYIAACNLAVVSFLVLTVNSKQLLVYYVSF